MKIYENIGELIGSTPLLRVSNFNKDGKADILAKLEYFNPAGSAKDRVAMSMIETAENMHVLREGGTIIEPTSGNTGVGLAAVGSAKGYRVILTMPDTMSIERRMLLKAFGGLEGVKRAGKDELAGVNGISRTDAENIVKYFEEKGAKKK